MINEKKDACYHKVKSRYRVWPSAYASGALVKCRQKGADNWGSSSIKENTMMGRLLERARWKTELENGPLLTMSGDELGKDEVKALLKNKRATMRDKNGRMVGPKRRMPKPTNEMKELTPAEQRARIEQARLRTFQRNLPDDSPHKKPRIPGQRKRDPGSTLAQASRLGKKVDARQRKRQKELEAEAERQDESKKGVMPKMKMGVHKSREGGLTQKGVEAYRRANPGSKLKTAVTTKPSKLKKGSKSAKRRASFCARMGGMKKRLTSSKTANDPNSRINKALRKWNC